MVSSPVILPRSQVWLLPEHALRDLDADVTRGFCCRVCSSRDASRT